jgi:hypothetical protein
MMKAALTATDITDWLTPRQALAILGRVVENESVATRGLLERLRGGMVKAVAFNSAVTSESGPWSGTFCEIDVDHWTRIFASDEFWITGDLSYEAREYGESRTSTFRHFDVRFEPQSIKAMVDVLSRSAPAASAHAPAVGAESEPVQKGPRVTNPHLQAWFEFYKVVTPETEDTEDYAWAHARRCFPDKTVSRERVRELRGSLKRGPKKKSL